MRLSKREQALQDDLRDRLAAINADYLEKWMQKQLDAGNEDFYHKVSLTMTVDGIGQRTETRARSW